ncbi:MAG TPA: ligase-associated DNA damage response endonuclease PdeM [Chitinophagales bacterium]|nr:ligase-associated DNA damage response endonuclease PdeM [Chitinophagales bacterium]
MEIQHYGQTFMLSPQKCLYWPKYQLLLIADAHFAKETHFRKHGIAVPHGILQYDLLRIEKLIQQFQPKEIIFLGDMFHSEENDGLNEFINWRKTQTINMTLIIGNHDILPAEWYVFAKIKCIPNKLQIDNIVLSHDQLPEITNGVINFFGHLHPAVRLSGAAKQSLRLSCFWLGENFMVMPAFGRFTGAKSIRPEKTDTIYAVGEGEIFKL